MSDGIAFTVSTTLLMTLRTLGAMLFFGAAFFGAVFFGAAFFGALARLAGALFAVRFFAGFLEVFFDRTGAFFEDAFLLDDFLAPAFFAEDFLAGLEDFFGAGFFFEDFFAGFLEDFFADFLAAIDSLLFKTVGCGCRTFERKLVLYGSAVAQISM